MYLNFELQIEESVGVTSEYFSVRKTIKKFILWTVGMKENASFSELTVCHTSDIKFVMKF